MVIDLINHMVAQLLAGNLNNFSDGAKDGILNLLGLLPGNYKKLKVDKSK